MSESTSCIEVKNVSYSYNSQLVLDDVTLEIKRGEYVGILGPNGGGKTTLIKIILGILKPQSGEVRILDSTGKQKIGYIPQRINFSSEYFPATVEEVISSGLTSQNLSFSVNATKVQNIMVKFDIQKLAKKLISQLSGGEKQKVFIARSMVADPSILILDEPTVAIDTPSQSEFYDFLRDVNKNTGVTVVLISHDISMVATEVNKIFFLNNHIECFHSGEEFLKPQNLARIYDKNVNLISHHH
jgi:zinc transport system ATP-binding protein